MKTTFRRLASLVLPLAVLVFTAPAVTADETDAAAEAPFKPKEYDMSRYSKNFEKKSPFEFDPPPPVQEEVANNFEGVSLGGYCGNGNTLSVYLIVGKEKKRITVYGDGSPFKKIDKSGFRVISIKRGKSLSTTSVLLEKGGQQKEVTFDKETLTAKGGGAGAQTQMVIGPDGRPVQRTVVPRPAGAQAPAQVYQPPPAFIPGQSNVQNINAGNNPGGSIQSQMNAMQQQAAMNAQQQANQLLNTPNIPAPPIINPQPGQTPPPGQPGGSTPVPQRRRVVLPTQNQ